MKQLMFIVICLLVGSLYKVGASDRLVPDTKIIIVENNGIQSPTILHTLKHELLFKDDLNNIFWQVKETMIGEDISHNTYYSQIGKDGRLLELKDIINVTSFKKMQSPYYFQDKHYVYVHQQYPAIFPAINIIDIDPRYAVLLDDFYIRDNQSVYWLTKKLETKSSSFELLKLVGGSITLGVGDKYLFWNGDIVNKEIFDTFKQYFDDKKWQLFSQKYFLEVQKQ